MYEIYCRQRDERGLKDADVVRETKITKSTFSDWKSGRSKPKNDKLQKIADFFGVSIEYLMTGDEPVKKEPLLTSKDERDIAKTVSELMSKLDSQDGAPLFFDGEEITPETKILFEQQLKSLVTTVKEINKVKYHPGKNKE